MIDFQYWLFHARIETTSAASKIFKRKMFSIPTQI